MSRGHQHFWLDFEESQSPASAFVVIKEKEKKLNYLFGTIHLNDEFDTKDR